MLILKCRQGYIDHVPESIKAILHTPVHPAIFPFFFLLTPLTTILLVFNFCFPSNCIYAMFSCLSGAERG